MFIKNDVKSERRSFDNNKCEFYSGNHDSQEVEEFTGIPSDPEMVVEKLIKTYINR